VCSSDLYPLPEVDAGPDTTIYRDESARLAGVSNGFSFEWVTSEYLDNPTVLDPLCTPFNTIAYTLNATSEFGCKNSDTVRINVEVRTLILVPNAFTPNQDGLNDVFRIIRTLNIERVYDVFVFNRWGQKVFEGRNSTDFWDGTFNGQPQGLGVYVYVIRALTRDGDEITETGNVTLLR
jgi:gliding motility-associated-like protein